MRPSTHHAELRKLFPGVYPADQPFDGLFSGDAPEAATMGLAWTLVASHALWGRDGLQASPQAWYADAADRRAHLSLSASLHVEGPWGSQSADVVRSCDDSVVDCISGDVSHYVKGVLDKHALLADAPCFTEPLDPNDVRAHVRELATLWGEDDGAAAEQAALGALDGSGFHREAPAVLAALDTHFAMRLTCPEDSLWQVYHFSCP